MKVSNKQAAAMLLDSGLLDDVTAQMRAAYIRMWSGQTDQAERDRLWLAYNMVDDCLVMFRAIAQEGALDDAA